jgi:hypothetical protein
MSNPLLDLSLAVAIGAVALLGTMVVMPRPKPELPPVEKAEPQPAPAMPAAVTQAEQVKQITADIKTVRTDLAEIREAIRVQQALKSLPQEASGDE